MKTSYLKKFIGVDRWSILYRSYRRSTKDVIDNSISTNILLVVIMLTFIPILSAAYLNPYLATIIFGIICVVSILLRNKLKYPAISLYKNIKFDLAITHTAFAFGCIPAALLLLLSPETITQHSDLISHSLHVNREFVPSTAMSFLKISAYVIFISGWTAILEEVVYRGLLLSALRRWEPLKNSSYRDVLAILVSALIFGFAHFHSWGLYASIALVGLGIGFGIAYICSKEELLPLIIYHFLFDLISLSIVALN